MRNKNTLNKAEYAVMSAIFALLFMMWYLCFSFVGLGGLTVGQSHAILWGMVAVGVALGVLCTLRTRRNYFNIFVNITLPYEFYTIISYWPYRSARFIAALAIAAVLSAAYFLAVLCQKIRRTEKREQVYVRRAKFAALGCRTLVAVCLLAVFVPIAFRIVLGNGLNKTSVPSVDSADAAEEWTVKNHIEEVKLLRQDAWKELDTQKKLDILGVLANIEIRYLGLPHEVYVCADFLQEGIAAQYSDAHHRVTIDLNYLNNGSAYGVLRAELHEMYHAYQHAQVALLEQTPEPYRRLRVFAGVEQYAREFDSYVSAQVDENGYAAQSVEVMAERYAENAALEYYYLIEEYTAQD